MLRNIVWLIYKTVNRDGINPMRFNVDSNDVESTLNQSENRSGTMRNFTCNALPTNRSRCVSSASQPNRSTRSCMARRGGFGVDNKPSDSGFNVI